MKRNRTIMGTALAIFAVAIMVSSTTAVPIVNIEAVESSKNKELTDLLQSSIDKNFLSEDIFYSNPTGLTHEDIIEKCWEYWKDPEVRQAIEQAKEEIDHEIENRFTDETTRILVKEFFNLESLFNISEIKKRIEYVHVSTLFYDVQDLTGVTDDNKEFNDTYRGKQKKLFEIWYHSGLSWENLTGMFYPIVDLLIYSIIFKIAVKWLIPMALLFGVSGIRASVLIFLIYFGIATLPLSIYVATRELLKNDKEFKNWLIEITIQFGLFGLTTIGLLKTLKKIRTEEWFELGRLYVLSKILFINLFITPNGWEFETGETPPISGYNNIQKILTSVQLFVNVDDNDEMYYRGLGLPQTLPRDYVQLGIDWDNDGDFDEWTLLTDPFTYKTRALYSLPHDFGKYGTYTIGYAPRDMWGVKGETKTTTITLSKEDGNCMYPVILNNFPILKTLIMKISLLSH
jgi:hypothetical protein